MGTLAADAVCSDNLGRFYFILLRNVFVPDADSGIYFQR